MTVRTEFANRFLSIQFTDSPAYFYARIERGDGNLVAVLPYKYENGEILYCQRLEICPAHGTEMEACAITGGIENENSPFEAAILELQEESGYNAVRQMDFLGELRPSKQMDTIVYCYAFDVTGIDADNPTTDGSELEQNAGIEWVTLEKALENTDATFLAMVLLLNRTI